MYTEIYDIEVEATLLKETKTPNRKGSDREN